MSFMQRIAEKFNEFKKSDDRDFEELRETLTQRNASLIANGYKGFDVNSEINDIEKLRNKN